MSKPLRYPFEVRLLFRGSRAAAADFEQYLREVAEDWLLKPNESLTIKRYPSSPEPRPHPMTPALDSGMREALKALHVAPLSTLEITKIKERVLLADERTIHQIASALIAIRSAPDAPHDTCLA